jgi:LmbE family N-acetylglucosaminyl deacetylase
MKIEPGMSIVAILAHPDDVKSVTGVALRALAHQSVFSLILVTKGEALYSATRSTLTPLEMGQLRLRELHRFLNLVGIPEENLSVIGIPDGSQTLPALRDDFFQAKGEPFLDPLLQVDQVPYDDVYRPGMAFYGETFLDGLCELLLPLKPDMILTHHPQDDHADHRAVSFFARQAHQQLHRQGKLEHTPSIYAPLIYYRRCGWPPAGDTFFVDKIVGRFPGLEAIRFHLTEPERTLKARAAMEFTPTLSEAYIRSNMKADEVLWRL